MHNDKNIHNINLKLIGGDVDCSIIEPEQYNFCDNPIDKLSQEQRTECDRVRGPYRYDININDPEMNSTKCKKNRGAISYECAKERFNTYYDLKNSTDSGKMRGKLFDAKYNKKSSLILYPGEACSSKYLHGEGVKTFDIWGVDAFPEDTCANYNADNHVSSMCYHNDFKSELKYGPEVSRLIPEKDKDIRLYNQYFKGKSEYLEKARKQNWKNYNKNPNIRKISPKTNDEFLDYMIERNISEDRPKKKNKEKKDVPKDPIFLVNDEPNYEEISEHNNVLFEDMQPNYNVSPNVSESATPVSIPNVSESATPVSIPNVSQSETPVSIPNVSESATPVSIPNVSQSETPVSIPNVSESVTPVSIPNVSQNISPNQISENSEDLEIENAILSEEDILSNDEMSEVDEDIEIPELEEDDNIDFDKIFKQPIYIDYSSYIIEQVKEGYISTKEEFDNLIVIDEIVARKHIFYLFNAENNFIYEIPLNIDVLKEDYDLNNKRKIEQFIKKYIDIIFERLNKPYKPIGSYLQSNQFEFYSD